jgi:hypothetical protein
MDFLRVALALVTVFGLLGLLYFVSNRAKVRNSLRPLRPHAAWPSRFRLRSSASDSGSLDVLRRVSLTPTHQVHFLRSGSETFLLCTHPRGCTPLRSSDAFRRAEHEGAASEECERYAS